MFKYFRCIFGVAVCAIFVNCNENPKNVELVPPSICVKYTMPNGNNSNGCWGRNITVPEYVEEIELTVEFTALSIIAEISVKKTEGDYLIGYPKKDGFIKDGFDSKIEHTAKWTVNREKPAGSNEVVSYDVSVIDNNSNPRSRSATIVVIFQ
jgi:hypothetical protein